MASLGLMSTNMLWAAHSQHEIGWREFMEGKVYIKIATMQRLHCAAAPCRMNGHDWMKHSIYRMLQLSFSVDILQYHAARQK